MRIVLIFILFILSAISSLTGDIINYKLPNGLTVILKEKHNVPLVTAQIWVKAGSITEEEFAGCGISHYIEHMLFTTTKKHSGEYIAKKMKSLGCDMNGYTSFEETVFHFTFGSENLKKILPVMKEMIFEPAFKEKELVKEKNVILKEINMNLDDPNRYFSNLLFDSAYERSYFKYPVIGYKSLFKKLSRKDLIKYYNRMYVPDNMALIIVGDFDSNKIKPVVSSVFGNIARKPVHYVSLIKEPLQCGMKKIVKYRKDIKFPRIALIWKTVDIRSKDLFPLDVLSLIIGKGRSSVLNLELKEKKGTVRSISSYSYTPVLKGIFSVEAVAYDYNKVQEITDDIISLINKLKKNISDDILNRAKKIALVDYLQSKASVNDEASDIGINWISTGNLDFSRYYVENLKKVKPADIRRVIDKYFNKNNMTIVMLLPETAKNKNNLKDKHFKVNNSLKQYKLDNGIKLIMYEDKNTELVSVNVLMKGGVLFEENDKKGITYFLSKMLLAGTKKYSKKNLIELFENNGGTISTFAGNNSFGIRTLFLKDDTERLLPVIKDILKNSIFPEKEIEKTRKEIISEIESVSEKLFGIAKIKLFNKMFYNTPYENINIGSVKSIKNITRKDIVRYYRKFFTKDNVVVSVAGNMDYNIIKSVFGNNIKISSHKLKFNRNIQLPVKKSITFKTNTDKEQSLLLVSYYGPNVTSEDRYTEEMLWYVLNGQGSRLFVNLREKRELAYYVGMFPFYGLKAGLMNFYIGTVKNKIDIAHKGMLKEIKKLIKSGITKQELESAKREALSDKIKEFEGVNNIAFNIGLNYLYGYKDITINSYKRRINSISVAEVNKFIEKYFKYKPWFNLFILGL